MPTDKEPAVFIRQTEARLADLPFDAAAVNDHGLRRELTAHALEIVRSSLRIDRREQQRALSDVFLGQRLVHGARQKRKLHGGGIPVEAQHAVPCIVIRPGERAADQPEADNADRHCSASRTARIFLASSANCSGLRDCAPSHSACMGSLCTSTITPSAPQATAASAMGGTRRTLPVA